MMKLPSPKEEKKVFNLLSLFVLAFAVSLDGFGVGVTYGLRKITIPLRSIVIIAICSALVILFSMQIGVLLTEVVSVGTAKAIGGLILIGIGIWAVYNVTRKREEDPTEPAVIEKKETNTVVKIEIKQLGIVIQILKTPTMADFDKSGSISSMEAAVLGIALSLDAFGAGIGAALIGFNPIPTAIVIAGMSGLFIYSGLKLGLSYSGTRWIQKLSYLPGFILILMGLLKLV
jgi:putative sporulation protein YtaF